MDIHAPLRRCYSPRAPPNEGLNSKKRTSSSGSEVHGRVTDETSDDEGMKSVKEEGEWRCGKDRRNQNIPLSSILSRTSNVGLSLVRLYVRCENLRESLSSQIF
ncbi:hypothetical protein Trydic_g14506 [Trypoxylus dichotomus]